MNRKIATLTAGVFISLMSIAALSAEKAQEDYVITQIGEAAVFSQGTESPARACALRAQNALQRLTGTDNNEAARAAADDDLERTIVEAERRCMDVRNLMDQAQSRLVKAAELRQAQMMEPEPAEPDPEPVPDPVPPVSVDGPSIAFIVAGKREEANCAPSGTVTTHTGRYRYLDCGLTPAPLNAGEGPNIYAGRVGLWLNANGDWALDIGAFTRSTPFVTAVDGTWPNLKFTEAEHLVSINGAAPQMVRVAMGSVKTLDNGKLAPLTAEGVRDAVEAHLLPNVDMDVYTRLGMVPTPISGLGIDEYDPARIWSYDTRRASIGDVSATGGESAHGRAALSEWDANLIRLAEQGDNEAFAKAAAAYLDGMRWARSMPNETILSRVGPHMLDPQKPIAEGDYQYVVAGTTRTFALLDPGSWVRPDDYPYFQTATIFQQNRDMEHAHNMGDVWFAATGDPRAALHLQARAAWAMAYPWQGYEKGRYTALISSYASERATLNFLRDTALNPDILADTVTVEGETPLWGKARWSNVRDDMYEQWAEFQVAKLAGTDDKARQVQFFGDVDYGATSPFMIHKYGLVVAYRLADRGYPALMQAYARGWMFRFGKVGGEAGYYPKKPANGSYIIDFPPADQWGADGEGAIAWWTANNPSFADKRANWDGEEQSIVALTVSGFDMLQDLTARGLLEPIEGLDDAQAANLARVAATDRAGYTAYNVARYAVDTWE